MNLRDNISSFLTQSMIGIITEKISDLSNSVVSLVEVKAKFLDVFASNQTEACNPVGVGVRMTQRQNDTVRHFGTVTK